MSSVLQKGFIFILNPVYSVICRLDENVRNIIIQAVCCCLPISFVLSHSGVFSGTILQSLFARTVLGTVLLVLLILFSMDSPLHIVPWRDIIYIPLFLCGLGLIIIGFLHSIGDGFQFFGFQLALVFPCLAFVWNNRGDYEKLFDAMARGFVIVGLLYYVLCIILAITGHFVMIDGRWAGTMGNVNCLGMFGIQVVLSALYLFIRSIGNRAQGVYAIAAGAGLGLVILSGARVSLLVCVAGFGACVIYSFVHRNTIRFHIDKEAILRHGLSVALFTVILVSALWFIPTAQLHNQSEVSETTQSESPVTMMDRLDVRNASPSGYASGRVQIWRQYASQLNLTGNDYDKTDWDKLFGGVQIPAHNLFLAIAYRCGIPVGLLFVFLEVVAGLIAIGLLFNRKASRTCYLFLILFVIAYGIESTLDVAVAPFSRASPLMFYISLICIIPQKGMKNDSRNDSKPSCHG